MIAIVGALAGGLLIHELFWAQGLPNAKVFGNPKNQLLNKAQYANLNGEFNFLLPKQIGDRTL